MAGHRRKGCFLFYIYGYCLGLGTGIIAAILSWTESAPAASKALLCSGLVISISALIIQALVPCRSCRCSQTVVRSVVNIIGLSVAAVVTSAGTFLNTEAEGLFFLCGTFAVTLYVVTIIAFTVNLVRNQAHKDTSRTQTSNENSGDESCLDAVSRYMPNDPYLGDPFAMGPMMLPSTDREIQPTLSVTQSSGVTPDVSNVTIERTSSETRSEETDTQLSITELAALGVPVGILLPSYSEIADTNLDLPPQYSDVNTDIGPGQDDVTLTVVPASPPIQEGEQPPRYDDIIQNTDRTSVQSDTIRGQTMRPSER